MNTYVLLQKNQNYEKGVQALPSLNLIAFAIKFFQLKTEKGVRKECIITIITANDCQNIIIQCTLMVILRMKCMLHFTEVCKKEFQKCRRKGIWRIRLKRIWNNKLKRNWKKQLKKHLMKYLKTLINK